MRSAAVAHGPFAALPASSARARPEPWDLLMIAVAGMILTYVWRFQELFTFLATIQAPAIASLTAFGAYLWDRDPRRGLRYLRHPVTFLLLATVVLIVWSIPWSIAPGSSFRFLVRNHSKTVLLFVLVAAAVRNFVDLKRIAALLVVGGAVYALVVVTRFEVGSGGRLGDLHYYDANDLALVVVCTFPLALYFGARAERRLARLAALLVLVLFVLTIVKTGSRGGFLGLIAVSTYLLIAFRAIPARIRIAAVTGAFLLLMLVASETYWGLMRTMLNPQDDYNWAGQDETGRMEVWKRGIGYMLANPFTGVGAAQFPTAEGTLSELAERQQYGQGWKWSAAHNSFVQIGAELGVIGLAVFVALLVYGYLRARRRRTQPSGTAASEAALGHALAGAIVGYAVAGFFLSQGYSLYLYAICGMIVALGKLEYLRRAAPAPVAAAPQRVNPGRARLAVTNASALRSAPAPVSRYHRR